MIINHKQVTDMGWKIISMIYQGEEAANIFFLRVQAANIMGIQVSKKNKGM